ncbi:hypothetical protein [Clostridium hydrogenum]|uniref:hypothetical protein n=1 Tax=Clostridium hydrogenum TaxID=2855764 RepID=UPI001F2D5048|nr:hypothetical protein [Clostridium hydrogenum]
MREENELYVIIINFIKCFLILIIIGMLLPELVDKIIVFFILNHNEGSGSDFVYNMVNSRQFVLRFMYYFEMLLR